MENTISKKKQFQYSFLLGFLISLLGFYWVAYSLKNYGNLPWPIAIFGLLLFSLFNQPQYVAYGLLRSWILKKLSNNRSYFFWFPLWGALTYTACDAFLPKLFLDTNGHAFHQRLTIMQWAEVGGVHLLTFFTVLSNEIIFRVYSEFKNRKEPSIHPSIKKTLGWSITWIGVFSFIWLWGDHRLKTIEEIQDKAFKNEKSVFSFTPIQANIGNFEKVAAEKGIYQAANHVVDQYIELSEQALEENEKIDFLVWPETAYPSTFRVPSTTNDLFLDQRIENFVRIRNIPLFFGGYDRKNNLDYNSFFFLKPQVPGKRDLHVYHKNILLLFGETIPGAETFPALKRAFPQVGNFGQGPGPEALSYQTKDLREIKISPIICYEILFPSYPIESVKKGGELLLNITNDSWFGPYGEPALHFALTKFRSIETRVPQLRATNTGITALVLPSGAVPYQSAIFEKDIHTYRVPKLPPISTLMLQWGDWFGTFSLILSGLLTLLLIKKPKWL
tara:strand:- start:4779 stop:6287 length:1509 start_codon:yes stop_codon:yes gene_type:complete